MIYRKETFPKNTLPIFQQHYLTEDMLLFDIETTGLSPAQNHIYCIGCGYLSGEEVVIELFFAENKMEEKPVLEAFLELLSTHSIVITFNGTTFDLPFVQKRMAHWGYQTASASDSLKNTSLTETSDVSSTDKIILLESLKSIDLYREAAGMKSLLHLPSYRQKSIEQFLGCSREDKYDGGQLIEIYHQYAAHPDPEILSLLLLHNQEDVKGMFDLLGILSYYQLRDGQYEITDVFREDSAESQFENTETFAETSRNNSFCTDNSAYNHSSYYNMKFRTNYPLPQSIHMTCEGSSLLLNSDGGLIRFPLRHGFLKHFFSDCENYYYLPEEDYAIHKSVGAFVDSAHRRKATKRNCYVKKECDYITVPSRCGDGYLRKEYQDKNIYLTIPANLEDAKSFAEEYFADNLF
ncbi:MAG: ribonuclease H-like domain-containing protein [Clostridiales bacterium]|nr:ribonuclease H-like domain-containing protein [Clostridiales bacterium]